MPLTLCQAAIVIDLSMLPANSRSSSILAHSQDPVEIAKRPFRCSKITSSRSYEREKADFTLETYAMTGAGQFERRTVQLVEQGDGNLTCTIGYTNWLERNYSLSVIDNLTKFASHFLNCGCN